MAELVSLRLDLMVGSRRRPWNDRAEGLGCCLLAAAEKVGAVMTAEEEEAAAAAAAAMGDGG